MSTNFNESEDNSMKETIGSFVRKALKDERGQVLPWLAVVMVGMLSAAGLSIDVGRAYVVKSQLQNFANAAALAAAGEVYNTSSTNGFSAVAANYSAGASGDQNYSGSMGSVTTNVTSVCLSMLLPTGETCSTNPAPNAVKVVQTARVPTYFMALAGIKTLSITTSAYASMQGMPQHVNLAVILDATESMSSAPPSGSCPSSTSTEFACALYGVQTLLQGVNPCGGVSGTCSASNAAFRLALFSFPNVTTATVSDDWTCGGTPTNEAYTLPISNGYQPGSTDEATTLTSYTPLNYVNGGASIPTSTYEVTPVNTSDGDANGFVTDYYSQGATNPANLNSSSSVVRSVTGCMKNPGGESTYYGGVIYAAQAALAAEQALYGGQNYLILLSDGQAQAASSKFPSTGYAPTSSQTADGFSVVKNSTSNTTTNLTNVSHSFGYYPDFHDECQQAIMAAQAAQAAGTTVVSVAFGSEASGCSSSSGGTDSTTIATATTGNSPISYSSLTPCLTMKNIASPPSSSGTTYFFADTSSASNGCTDTAHNIDTISGIFSAITDLFTTPRLLPSNAQ
jgi:Flp pilus assembly protein TadG